MKPFFSLILSALAFSLAGVYTRYIAEDLGPLLQIFIRFIIMSLIFTVIGIIFKQFSVPLKKDVPLFIFRGFLIVIDFFCFVYAVNHLELGAALFLFFTSNLIISFLYGRFLLNEKLTKIKLLSFLLALVGLLIFFGADISALTGIGSLAALISGSMFAINIGSSKSLTDNYSITQVNLGAYLTALVISLPAILISDEQITFNLELSTWSLLIQFSILIVAAFYGSLYGYKYMEAQKAGLVMLSELIFVLINGFIFFNGQPSAVSLLGGLIILIALALPNLKVNK